MSLIYRLIKRLIPQHQPPTHPPQRIVIVKPCCIGDVVMATPLLMAVRAHYPHAHLTFAVGSWSKAVIEKHPAIDSIIDLGADAHPERNPFQLARILRAGRFDLAIVLDRSPYMSVALMASGIPNRAGLDSAGRGFGYTVRAKVDPVERRHESRIYLDVAESLNIPTAGFYANIPVNPADLEAIKPLLPSKPYAVIAPIGGDNPGMVFSAKRWTPHNFARLADALADQFGLEIVLLGSVKDQPILDAVVEHMSVTPTRIDGQFSLGQLSFGQIGALAHLSRVYIGNDTGLTHLAAASGARTVMILGPSDPERYAPFVPDALALWKPVALNSGGVAQADVDGWDWERDGIGFEAVKKAVFDYLSVE
jgi:ADP-heptose:LPS heptosyltransferase